MAKDCKKVKIKSNYFSNLTVDGGSNAIDSLVKYEVATRFTRECDLNFHVCYAHQNKRAAAYELWDWKKEKKK